MVDKQRDFYESKGKLLTDTKHALETAIKHLEKLIELEKQVDGDSDAEMYQHYLNSVHELRDHVWAECDGIDALIG